MGKIENWIKWHPIENLSENYFIETMYMEDGNLIVNLFCSRTNNRLTFIFKNILAYRSVEEGYRLTIPNYFTQDTGQNLYGCWTFFKVCNSNYVQWLTEQVSHKINLSQVIHFGIASANCIVDIITCNEPIIKI